MYLSHVAFIIKCTQVVEQLQSSHEGFRCRGVHKVKVNLHLQHSTPSGKDITGTLYTVTAQVAQHTHENNISAQSKSETQYMCIVVPDLVTPIQMMHAQAWYQKLFLYEQPQKQVVIM